MALLPQEIDALLEEYPIDQVLNSIAGSVRQRAGYLEQKFPDDSVSRTLAIDYRSIAKHCDIAANYAASLLG